MLRRFLLATATIFLCVTQTMGGERLSLSCTPVSGGGANPVTRIDVSYDGERFSVIHTAANGERIDRASQYHLHVRSKSDPLSWEGTNRKRRHLMMVGKIVPRGESYQYIEQLYDAREGGEKTYETRASCLLRNASPTPPAEPAAVSAEAPVQTPSGAPAPEPEKATNNRAADCQKIADSRQRLICYDTLYPPTQPPAEEAHANKAPVTAAGKPASDNLTESDLDAMRATYEKNQARFARDYVGRNFQATLQIEKITRNAAAKNRFDISLDRGIVCATEDDKVISSITNLNKGDKVRISGVIHDITSGNLELHQCQVNAGS